MLIYEWLTRMSRVKRRFIIDYFRKWRIILGCNFHRLSRTINMQYSETLKTQPFTSIVFFIYSDWRYQLCQIWAVSWQNQQCGCAPSEDSDQPGRPASLFRDFALCSVGSWGPKISSSGRRRLWSDWADAQADLSLRWAHSHIVGFVMRRLISYQHTIETIYHKKRLIRSLVRSAFWSDR